MDVEPISYFGLTHNPFSPVVSETIPYETRSLRETLGELYFFLRIREGLALLIGDDGIGKTTTLRKFAQKLDETYIPIFLEGTYESEEDALKGLCEKTGLILPSLTEKDAKRALQELVLGLFKKRREIVLIVDEAQNISPRVLDLLTHLSEVQFPLFKPFHIILSGNRVFFDRLAQKRMRHVVKSISVVHIMRPISQGEVMYYVNHRLNCASSLFLQIKTKVIDAAFLHSDGNPLKLNTILERALLLAAKRKTMIIDEKIAKSVLNGKSINVGKRNRRNVLLVTLIVVLFILFFHLIVFGPQYLLDYWITKILIIIKGSIP